MTRLLTRTPFIAGALLLAMACGGDATPPQSVPTRLLLSSEGSLIGLKAQFTLVATVLDAESEDLTSETPVQWSSSDPAIAAVTQAGLITGVALGGPVVITASAGNLTATFTARVVPAQIVIAPPLSTLQIGTTAQLSATALDALRQPIPSLPIVWTNDTPSLVAFDAATRVVTAIATGDATIRATAAGQSGGLTMYVGAPTAYDGGFGSAEGANPVVDFQVVFGRVTTFSATYQAVAGCTLSWTMAPNAPIEDNGPTNSGFGFVPLPIGPPQPGATGIFGSFNQVNGSLAFVSTGPPCPSARVSASYSAQRR